MGIWGGTLGGDIGWGHGVEVMGGGYGWGWSKEIKKEIKNE